MTEQISTAKAKGRFSEMVSRVGFGKERVVLTRRGKPLAAVVPVEDLERLEALEDQEDLKAAEKALREFKKSGERAASLEEVARDLGITLPKTKA